MTVPCYLVTLMRNGKILSIIMAKIKIITETLPDRCEICHKSDLFEPSKGYCARCSAMTISEQLVHTKFVQRPTGITVEAKDNFLLIKYRDILMVTLSSIFIFPLSILCLLSLLLIVTGNNMYSSDYVGAILGLIGCAGYTYIFIARIIDSTEIIATNKELTITHRCLPGFRRRFPQISTKKISQIKGIEFTTREGKSFLSELIIVMDNGKKINTGLRFGYYEKDVAHYIKMRLECYLGINNRNITNDHKTARLTTR